MEDRQEAAIAVEGLSLARAGRDVLQDVDLAFRVGELVAVVGPNGAGKSSLLQAICGLIAPLSGQVRLGGRTLKALAPAQRAQWLAYLPQGGSVAWNLPVVEVVGLGVARLGLSGPVSDRLRARALSALAEVEAEAFADRGVAELSGGERARVLLARALASEARMILADEPVAGLDPQAQLLVMERLKTRAATGQGVVACLHDLELARRFADRVVVIDRGRIRADGSPETALDADVLQQVFGLRRSGQDAGTPVLERVRS